MRSAKKGHIMGRPKVSNLRDLQLKLNFTAAEYECVVRRAKAQCMRPTHFARRVVLNTDAHAPRTQNLSNLERLNYLALSRVGNNLNQMMRHLHRTGEPAPADLERLLVEIRQVIEHGVKKWL
jgi:hypothetical protein